MPPKILKFLRYTPTTLSLLQEVVSIRIDNIYRFVQYTNISYQIQIYLRIHIIFYLIYIIQYISCIAGNLEPWLPMPENTITRFKVTMKISPLVQISQALKNLETPISDFSFREKLFSIFHKLVKVAFLEGVMYEQVRSDPKIQ